MPTGTTRFLTNLVPGAMYPYYGASYLDLPFLAGGPITNWFNQDRYSVAAVDGTSTGSAIARILCDFSSAKNFSYIGVLNLDTGPTTGFPSTFDFDFLSTTATNNLAGCTLAGPTLTAPSSLISQGFFVNEVVTGCGIPTTNAAGVFIVSIAGGGLTATLSSSAFSGSGTISGYQHSVPVTTVAFPSFTYGGGKNAVVALPSVINARRVIISFNTYSAPFSLSRFLFTAAPTDLGVSYMAGSTDAVVRQRTHTVTAGGTPITNEPGRPYRRMSLRFGSSPRTLRDAISLQAANAPGIILTADNEVHEYDLDGDVLERTHVWGSPDLYDLTLPIRTLP